MEKAQTVMASHPVPYFCRMVTEEQRTIIFIIIERIMESFPMVDLFLPSNEDEGATRRINVGTYDPFSPKVALSIIRKEGRIELLLGSNGQSKASLKTKQFLAKYSLPLVQVFSAEESKFTLTYPENLGLDRLIDAIDKSADTGFRFHRDLTTGCRYDERDLKSWLLDSEISEREYGIPDSKDIPEFEGKVREIQEQNEQRLVVLPLQRWLSRKLKKWHIQPEAKPEKPTQRASSKDRRIDLALTHKSLGTSCFIEAKFSITDPLRQVVGALSQVDHYSFLYRQVRKGVSVLPVTRVIVANHIPDDPYLEHMVKYQGFSLYQVSLPSGEPIPHAGSKPLLELLRVLDRPPVHSM